MSIIRHPGNQARPPRPVALQNVHPVAARVIPPTELTGQIDPTLARIARNRPRFTTDRIEGRPVVIYQERDRLHWGKLVALVAAVMTPILAVVAVAAYALAWLVAHWRLIAGALVLVAVVAVLVRTLLAAGVCCPGLHCFGCGHR